VSATRRVGHTGGHSVPARAQNDEGTSPLGGLTATNPRRTQEGLTIFLTGGRVAVVGTRGFTGELGHRMQQPEASAGICAQPNNALRVAILLASVAWYNNMQSVLFAQRQETRVPEGGSSL
jgi:dihydrodipicolinate reductase